MILNKSDRIVHVEQNGLLHIDDGESLGGAILKYIGIG
jgi:hypothetical protein